MNVNLVVVEGKPLGAVIPLKAERFVIGREPGCQLRPRSAAVADRQCAILRAGPKVSVRDLGGALGTLVNNRCLGRGDEVRVRDGDRLQIGQLIFAIQIEAAPADADPSGGMQDWLAAPTPHARRNGASSLASPDAVGIAPQAAGKPSGGPVGHFGFSYYDEGRRVACLGLSPGQVAEESGVRALRAALLGMAAQPRQRRLLLDLSGIDDLPSLAVGMLMTLARRCEAAGGELRLCAVPVDVQKMLDALNFETVVACYPDQDGALADPWD